MDRSAELNSKNSELLKSFVEYCESHPHERFWQALRNWSRWPFIGAGFDGSVYHDTFSWEGNSLTDITNAFIHAKEKQ